MEEDKKAVKKPKKTPKYKGPKYNKGIVANGKTYQPAKVPPDQVAEYIEENPIMSKYFK